MSSGYSYLWEFQVAPEHQAEFERHYGPSGSWAQLFRRAPGYIETLLLKDHASAERYLTLDRWRDSAAWLAFQSEFADAYAELDRQCEPLTIRETSLGSFDSVGPQRAIVHVALLVRDYDEAIAWFTGKLGFQLLEDSPRPEPGKRWVLVAPAGTGGTGLLLARAAGAEQERCIGQQGGGRVFLFLRTDDFWRDYRALQARGIRFVREPSTESYGTVAVFEDLYGNRWDLLQYGT